jgi:hypothetical protein
MKFAKLLAASSIIALAAAACGDSSSDEDCADCLTPDPAAAAIVVDVAGAPETTEAGGSVELSITLSTEPDAAVTVPIAVDDEFEAEIDTSELVFTTLDWDVPQLVTVTGKDDKEADGNQTFNVLVGPANSTGDLFNDIAEKQIELTNIDGVCANGVVDGQEECEPHEFEFQYCDYGTQSCEYCQANCTLAQGTPVGFCGDGVVQDGHEECEPDSSACCTETCELDDANC